MTQQAEHTDRPIRVGVADKSPLIQAALTHLLKTDPRFELVDVWPDGESLLQAIDDCQIDVLVSGWVIKPGEGKYILDRLRARPTAPRVVIYTGASSDAIPAQSMAHGAAAYISKSERPELLLDTVEAVAHGRMVFPFLDVRKVHQSPLTGLTRRELEVLSGLAAGRTNKEIAADLDLSPNTVKFHVKNLFQKLGVHNRSQAIALYLKA
ncbi:MAG: response regulator transcription factor [Gammaproteobacteria bacterium]|nr:response regulator transcription factor [Gammaproteobacteria bacterium]